MAITGFAWIAVAVGAVLGAWMRWMFTLVWQGSALHLGVIVSNLLGGLLVGAVLAFSQYYLLSKDWKLFIVTGFLGSLTTFSSFSVELLSFFLAQRWWHAFLFFASNVFGTFVMTLLGYLFMRGLLKMV